QPLHTVTLDAFRMGECEVTQAQFHRVMGRWPAGFPDSAGGGELPVEQVNWFDAAAFCNALSLLEGLEPCYDPETWECNLNRSGYRLPTEAEWEYAARAGTTTKYCTGNSQSDLDRAGWYAGNSAGHTHPVRQKIPNAWGLYDMHGNVWEWCGDWRPKYSAEDQDNPIGAPFGTSRVVRGGSWNNTPFGCRSACREHSHPGRGYSYLGFRVVRR
ncbi:MAG: formylglycine-generating enzyme family protein, partial [Gemmatimonadota bacterium]|nr:formylglycine-generating enzyme family protein [Gemmatimonadota bacterium]